jgi:uncharacterized protein
MQAFLENIPSAHVALALGVITGLLFGALAQQSRFCLRSACVEFWRSKPGPKFAIWLFTFGTALLLTQWLMATNQLQTGYVRQLSTTGSMSGAIVGGLLFGVGMVLARGCASRLLVLSATGNQRALIAGLIVTVVAQASLRGVLSPAREHISGWWMVDAPHRDFSAYLPTGSAWLLAAACLLGAAWLARQHRVGMWLQLGAIGVGGSVALGWGLTQWHALWAFDVVAVKSVSFTGPSADTLMGLINEASFPMSFDTGIVMGVFAGAMAAAVIAREFKLQSFTEETGLARYIAGAVLMGFGGMLAGGCAVGAGITGGAVMATTAWVALLCMWLAAGLTDALIDKPRAADAYAWLPSWLIRA